MSRTEVFDFGIFLSSGAVAEMLDSPFVVRGVATPSTAAAPIPEPAQSGGDLRLGFQLFEASTPQAPTLEGRADIHIPAIRLGRPAGFEFAVPSSLSETGIFVLLVDFLYEGEFWFHQRGVAPKLHGVSRRGSRLRIETPGGALARSTPEAEVADSTYRGSDPRLGAELAASLEAIAATLGLEPAIDLAYVALMERRPERSEAAEIAEALKARRYTLEDLCASIQAASEFAPRAERLFANPRRNLAPWAQLKRRSAHG